MTEILDVVLLAFMVTTAIWMVRLRNLFAATMMAGIFSLLSAGMFTVLDAVDVAFTEAAVGAGISTVLMLATLDITTHVEKVPKRQPLLPLVLVLLVGAVLAYATLDMPAYGDPDAPIHGHMAPEFMQDNVPHLPTAHFPGEHGAAGEHGEHAAPQPVQTASGEAYPLTVGIPNIVTTTLASYRGYDTFGETTVIFTAATVVLLLIGRKRRDDEDDEEERA